jgi:hypothetical protein
MVTTCFWFLSLLLVVQVNADSLYSPDGQEKDPVTIPSLYEKGEQQEDSNAISTVVYGTEKQQIDPNALPGTFDHESSSYRVERSNVIKFTELFACF